MLLNDMILGEEPKINSFPNFKSYHERVSTISMAWKQLKLDQFSPIIQILPYESNARTVIEYTEYDLEYLFWGREVLDCLGADLLTETYKGSRIILTLKNDNRTTNGTEPIPFQILYPADPELNVLEGTPRVQV